MVLCQIIFTYMAPKFEYYIYFPVVIPKQKKKYTPYYKLISKSLNNDKLVFAKPRITLVLFRFKYFGGKECGSSAGMEIRCPVGPLPVPVPSGNPGLGLQWAVSDLDTWPFLTTSTPQVKILPLLVWMSFLRKQIFKNCKIRIAKKYFPSVFSIVLKLTKKTRSCY